MKIQKLLLWFAVNTYVAQGKFRGRNLITQTSSILSADNNTLLQSPIEKTLTSSGTCQKDAECNDGCFCAVGKCKYYGGKEDKRCAGQKNGIDLGDGGYCTDGRRDRYCLARDPNGETWKGEKDESKHEEEAPIGHAMEQAQEEANKDADKTFRKAARMDPKDMFFDDLAMMRGYLMPGKQPNVMKKFVEFLVSFCVIFWFAFFVKCCYADDRCPKTDRWDHVVHHARKDDPRIATIKPDVVLVFHKPSHAYADKDKQVKAGVLETALVGRSGNLPRSEKLLEVASCHAHRHSLTNKLKLKKAQLQDKVDKIKKTGSAIVDKHGPQAPPPSELEEHERTQVEEEAITEDKDTKIGEFRQALLQDLCEHLPTCGFDVTVFSSVDDDEIFVCIGLRNEKVVAQHLQRFGMKLQLQKEVVQTLHIKQPVEEVESSPPYIRYDRRLAGNVFGEGKSDLDIYKNFGAHSGNPVVISGTNRIRIIHQHLTSHLNLDYAVAQGLVVQWYPAHAEARVAELTKTWARWSLITDFSLRQPLSLINEYFGARVAFIFAWTGLYAKMLLCLTPIACLFLSLNLYVKYYGESEHWNRGSVMGFSLCVIVWAKMSFNLWKQEEAFMQVLWDLNGAAGPDRSMRPDFAGELLPDPTDLHKRSLQYSSLKYSLRLTISWVITLVYCLFVFFVVVTWLDLFRGRMNIAASICQAIMIQVFTQIYNVMAEQLTLFENHKFQDRFYTSYLKKMFIFQLVNQYSAFFYIAVKQQFVKGGCPNDDCVGLIQSALPVTLAILAVLQVVQVFVATLMVKFSLWWEKRSMRLAGMDEPVYSYVEEQGKYGDFRIREQIEFMTQLSLTLGYILIFGCVAPRIVPLCLLVFMIQLRAGGVLMTTVVNRTVPRITIGIGPWNEVFYFLMILGILFSAYLLVQFAPLFKGTMLLTKMTGFFLYCMIIGLIWIVVDLACPQTDPGAELLDSRRRVVEHVVMQIHEDKNFESAGGSTSRPDNHSGDSSNTHLVVEGEWDRVPKLMQEENVPEGSRSGDSEEDDEP